jgi:hypothetical protein
MVALKVSLTRALAAQPLRAHGLRQSNFGPRRAVQPTIRAAATEEEIGEYSVLGQELE